MASMYEIIMDLPLFKGIGRNHVSQFLEKTHLDIVNYEAGEPIVAAGERIDKLRFVIGGEIKADYKPAEATISIEERAGTGRVIMADRLFGKSTEAPCPISALSRVSLMEFSKEQYMSLVGRDRIYLLNLLNYLSTRAQRPLDVISRYATNLFADRLRLLVAVYTEPDATGVTLSGTVSGFAEYCNCTEKEFMDRIEPFCEGNGAYYTNGRIDIKSRNGFLGV